MRSHPARRPLAVASLVLLAACGDERLTNPIVEEEPAPLAAFDCTADLAAGTVRCRESAPSLGGARGDLLLGGQGTYVRLASSGVSYDGTSVFRADVTVQNLLGQPIGTTDGATPDADGIRVFFASGPTVTAGTGAVTVSNADGTDVFTGPGQPFIRYPEVLTAHQTSAAREWRFAVPPTVATFAFTVYVAAPVPDEDALAAIDLDPRTLASGGSHTCAISTDGDAWCWGTNGDGMLGAGAGVGVGGDSVPRRVAGGHEWRSLTAGQFHTCGVTTAGAAYCWGDNQTGQLGTGIEDDATEPTVVAGGRTWAMLDAGFAHTCGVTTDLQAFCWGANALGQLGDGTLDDTDVPVAVAGGFRWASVGAGATHSCGVTRGGAAMCWGEDADGRLGNGAAPASGTPGLVAGGHAWASVSVGATWTCGVTASGTGMCWGDDANGQAGNGASGGGDAPQAVAGGLSWAHLTAGLQTTCGVTTSGAAYCWGGNSNGQIGDGGNSASDAPVAVSGAPTWAWIDAGHYHTCGIGTAGEARCWGYNFDGQLGTGTTASVSTPATVAGGGT